MKQTHEEFRRGPRPRNNPRASEREVHEANWIKKKSKSVEFRRAHYGRKIESFDVYGKPLGKGDVSENDIRGEDIVTGLERAIRATGDPVFVDALAALGVYGLDGGKPRKSHESARRRCFGDDEVGYLKQMRWLIDHKKASIRSAAEEVSVKLFYDAPDYTVSVRRLRDKYSNWEKSGFEEMDKTEVGDLGFTVFVRPAPGARLINPDTRSELSTEGETVKYTAYWRRLFADGSIEVSRRDTGRETS